MGNFLCVKTYDSCVKKCNIIQYKKYLLMTINEYYWDWKCRNCLESFK